MAASKARVVAKVSLGLSLLTFAIFFLNVLIGGPLGKKPWMGDLWEMLTLLLAVTLFVAGTLAREAMSGPGNDEQGAPEGTDKTG